MAEDGKQSGQQVDEILNDFNRKNSTLTILIIVFVVITLLGGGGAAYFLLFAKDSGGAPDEEHTTAAQAPVALGGDKKMVGIISRLDPFIVNLNEVDASRYLKVAIELEVSNDETVKELGKRSPQVRDITVGVLSSKSFADIQGRDGKQRLKEELQTAINNVLGSGMVERIYFTQFVVQ